MQSAPLPEGGRKCGCKVNIAIEPAAGLQKCLVSPRCCFSCRDFVLTQYQHLKKANPKFPILIRECSGAEARLIARYGNEIANRISAATYIRDLTCCCPADFGTEHTVPINGLDSNAISSKLEDLVKKGESMPR